MSKIVFTVNMPGKSGDYPLDVPPNFTMREERILKQMSDVVSGEWAKAILERGSVAVIMASACIAMMRAGVEINPRVFDDLDPDNLSARYEPDEDDAPLADHSGNGTKESMKPTAKPSMKPSEPTPASTTPPGIGAPD